MTLAMTSIKKQWTKPNIQQLEGPEADKARALILAAQRETEQDYPEVSLKRRAG